MYIFREIELARLAPTLGIQNTAQPELTAWRSTGTAVVFQIGGRVRTSLPVTALRQTPLPAISVSALSFLLHQERSSPIVRACVQCRNVMYVCIGQRHIESIYS